MSRSDGEARLGVVEAEFEVFGYAGSAHLLTRGHRRIAAPIKAAPSTTW